MKNLASFFQIWQCFEVGVPFLTFQEGEYFLCTWNWRVSIYWSARQFSDKLLTYFSKIFSATLTKYNSRHIFKFQHYILIISSWRDLLIQRFVSIVHEKTPGKLRVLLCWTMAYFFDEHFTRFQRVFQSFYPMIFSMTSSNFRLISWIFRPAQT